MATSVSQLSSRLGRCSSQALDEGAFFKVRAQHEGPPRWKPWQSPPQGGRALHECLMRPPGESPRAMRQKVPPRKGRTPRRTVPLPGNTGPGAACRSNSYVASGDTTHQLNGAYSRADAPTPFHRCAGLARIWASIS